jgi:mono/diheme cytochrome c family protein
MNRRAICRDAPVGTVRPNKRACAGSSEDNQQPAVRGGTLRIAAMAALFGIFGSTLSAQEDSYTDGEKRFALNVKPLLKQKCFACHGSGEKIEGDLILTSRQEMLSGGESSDDVLIPGNGNGSLLFKSTTRKTEDCQMPPKEADKLTEDQTWLIRDWIDAGAPWPTEQDQAIIRTKYAEGVVVQTSGGLDDDWTQRRYKRENLWAYQPLEDPDVPSESKQVHPVDAFINKKLDAIGLTAARPADRRNLIRRATFDLIGLPPSPEEVEAFLKDRSPDKKAFEKVVDRLLDDPRYGEQWVTGFEEKEVMERRLQYFANMRDVLSVKECSLLNRDPYPRK